ncbi:MAG: hypothetical protein LLF74_06340 [Bacteroidales bacterium]|nr:hypothetical protein [Bacteroidales bacterium]
MGKQSAVDSLRESIRLLEIKQAEEEKILKEHLRLTYESLKPVNLLKSTIRDISSSVEIRSGMLETVISILSGYFTQKLIVRPGSNILTRILGTIMQFGVAGFIAKNAESIRAYLNRLFDKINLFVENKAVDPDVAGEEKAAGSE